MRKTASSSTMVQHVITLIVKDARISSKTLKARDKNLISSGKFMLKS
jgi:hypothetical protein